MPPALPSAQQPESATSPATPPRATEQATELSEKYADHVALAAYDGRASYYSDKLEGRLTASGEPYRATRFTAAHRKFRFNTVLRVTRIDNGRGVYVRVNDRGPFGDRHRIVDLSRVAAERLDMLRVGVAKVRVEVVEWGR